jgi:hypothetical protein
MSEDLRTLNQQNVWDAIDLLNRSSRDTSLRYDVDIFGFGRLTRYWGISYDYSLIRYVADKPAALILNCVEPGTRDAYTFFWGALPEFRTGRIAMSLVEAACRKLFDDGYLMHYAVAVPDRPVRRYRFVRFNPACNLVDMEAQSANLPEPDPRFLVKEIEAQALPQLSLLPGEYIHWCQRPAFLRRAAPFLKFLAACDGDSVKAYAVLVSQASNTTLSDIRSVDSCSPAVFELLRWLFASEHYRVPLAATYVPESSDIHDLLASAGFTVKRRFALLSQDLRATFMPEVLLHDAAS